MEFKNEMEKLSYAIGMNLAMSASQLPIELDPKVVGEGVTNMLDGGKVKLSQEDYTAQITELQEKLQAMEKKDNSEEASQNAEAGDEFLAENSTREGVVSMPSGLQYEVITEGEGKSPSDADKVRVHYTGTLIDGTVFDSSVQRGVPAEFGVNQVIKGWTEALQIMKTGSKYKLFIPSDLAYGERGAGQQIKPGSTLVFEVELLEVL
ncbi:MAG: FKBP-type peptidyl-prolyl cis-trans isomerase [Lentisphaerae bacterium]|nr:FKBP-type peptidyl-prolyl cis-trans isomerase [Lentisphaerota bacterium]MCP4101332.1 FKBP-type peptidyl-prolyl cis-trans isomerase [Lentisphaerota bacterium]